MTIELVQAAGVRVIDVPDLPDPVCFVSTQRVGLVRAELSDEDREAALEWLFQRACQPTR